MLVVYMHANQENGRLIVNTEGLGPYNFGGSFRLVYAAAAEASSI
jgi:hypothetical protein